MILKTDLYQITMAAAYVNSGMEDRRVTCEAFARRLPPQRRFMVMAGTEEIRDILSSIRFNRSDIEYLSEIPALRKAMTDKFVKWLENFRFTGDMWAMGEGEVVFAGEPLVQITAPLPEAQLVETIILSVLNHDIKIASKAARIVLAAQGRAVYDFGTRRTHHEAAIRAARAAYLAGFDGTSNIEAGKQFGIPVSGTMAHMWVMSFDDERKAFSTFSKWVPGATMLVDTHDTLKGVENAAKVGVLDAIRIDSGDLRRDSMVSRQLLDRAGKTGTKIIVSGDLDEHAILSLVSSGAPIDAFGVGTKLAVSDDVPSLGIVYKIVYDDSSNKPLMKLSPGKASMPGRKRVFLDQRNGSWVHLVALDGAVEDDSCELTQLMDCCLRRGRKVDGTRIGLPAMRSYCSANLSSLASLPLGYDLSSLDPGTEVPVRMHESLREAHEKCAHQCCDKWHMWPHPDVDRCPRCGMPGRESE